MRKLRTTALALTTAATVSFGGISVASAQDGTNPNTQGDTTQVTKPVCKDEENNLKNLFDSDASCTPQPWLRGVTGATIAAGILGIIGLILGPLYNFFTFNTFH